MSALARLIRRDDFDAMPDRHRVFKFFPKEPPRKGGIVVVDGTRCVVTKAKVRWDGPRWTILELRVRPAPLPLGEGGGS